MSVAYAWLQVCHALLPVLVRRKPLTRHLLQLPSWQKLADAFATRQAALSMQLSQKLQRALSRCLCLAASGFAEQAQAQQYVSHLLLRTAQEITGLARQEQRQLAAAAQRADVQLQVRSQLSLLLLLQPHSLQLSPNCPLLFACHHLNCLQFACDLRKAPLVAPRIYGAKGSLVVPHACAGVHDAGGVERCRHCHRPQHL